MIGCRVVKLCSPRRFVGSDSLATSLLRAHLGGPDLMHDNTLYLARTGVVYNHHDDGVFLSDKCPRRRRPAPRLQPNAVERATKRRLGLEREKRGRRRGVQRRSGAGGYLRVPVGFIDRMNCHRGVVSRNPRNFRQRPRPSTSKLLDALGQASKRFVHVLQCVGFSALRT